MSMDRMELNRDKIYRSVCDLQAEAQEVQSLVQDMTSTQTMRRRRTASAGLSVKARRQIAAQSINSYIPIAPQESEWGQRFDEIIARLKGCEQSADEAFLGSQRDMDSMGAMNNTTTENDTSNESEILNKSEIPNEIEPQIPSGIGNYKSEPILSKTEDDFTSRSKSNVELTDSLNNIAGYSNRHKVLADVHVDSQEIIMEDQILPTAIEEQEHCYELVQQCETSPKEKTEPVTASSPSLEEQTSDDPQLSEETPDPEEEEEDVMDCGLLSVEEHYMCDELVEYRNSPLKENNRMCQSLNEEGFRPAKTELKTLLRSLSVYRPDLASYSTSTGQLRRTDSSKFAIVIHF